MGIPSPGAQAGGDRNGLFRSPSCQPPFRCHIPPAPCAGLRPTVVSMTIPVPSDTSTVAPPALPDAEALALRAVHRAASELRRGTPVLLRGGDQPLAVAAAETVGARGPAELAALARPPPGLLLAPARAAAPAPPPPPRPGPGEGEGAGAPRRPPPPL